MDPSVKLLSANPILQWSSLLLDVNLVLESITASTIETGPMPTRQRRSTARSHSIYEEGETMVTNISVDSTKIQAFSSKPRHKKRFNSHLSMIATNEKPPTTNNEKSLCSPSRDAMKRLKSSPAGYLTTFLPLKPQRDEVDKSINFVPNVSSTMRL